MAKVRLSGIMFDGLRSVRVPGLGMVESLNWQFGEVGAGQVRSKGHDCVCTLDDVTGLITVERQHQGRVQRIGFHASVPRYYTLASDDEARTIDEFRKGLDADAKKGKAA